MKFLSILTITSILVLTSCHKNHSNNSNTKEIQKNVVDSSDKILEWGNTHCPVMEEKIKEDGGSTMYQGKLVRFCCPKCVKKFNNNPEEYHETLLLYTPEKTNSNSE